MDMIDEELNRLKARLTELENRIIPDFENRTQILFAQIMPMKKGTEERDKLEHEYTLLSKELSMRSDEIIRIRQDMQNLEMEKKSRR